MFDPLCEVQSDNGSMDITSPYELEGTLKEIKKDRWPKLVKVCVSLRSTKKRPIRLRF
ncbi:hypothetical protein BGW80DRAFT_1348563 [Lactifluus volemus]|nr:hypothetical protein BGW80DRAFT_1348563 [Lactifluus volemus]